MAVKGKSAKRDHRLTRMNFSKDVFKNEDAVTKFLDDNGITGCDIEDDGDVFVAKSTTNGDVKLEKAVQTKTKHAGVTMFLAEVKAAADDTADDDDTDADTEGEAPTTVEAKGNKPKPAPKAATKVKTVDGETVTKADGEDDADEGDEDTDTALRFPSNKYDWWAGYMSNEGSLMGVLRDGMDYDNLPPGMDEVMSAVFTSTGNVLGSSEDNATKETKIKQIGEDFATLTMGMFEMFTQATEDSTKSANTERKAKAKAFVDSFSASVTRAAKGGAIASDVNVVTEPKAKGAVTIDTLLAEEDDNEETNVAAIIGKAVAEAIAPLSGEIATIKAHSARVEREMRRSPSRRSDSSIIDNLAPDNDDEDEAEVSAKAEVIERIGDMLGRRKSNA